MIMCSLIDEPIRVESTNKDYKSLYDYIINYINNCHNEGYIKCRYIFSPMKLIRIQSKMKAEIFHQDAIYINITRDKLLEHVKLFSSIVKDSTRNKTKVTKNIKNKTVINNEED